MRSAGNWHKWLMIASLGLALSARPIVSDYTSITEKFETDAVARCNQKCPFQNRTGDGHFDLSCGSNCTIQRCTLGCSLWKQGLEQTCQTTCNVTSESVVSRELYCVMGCNEALNNYFQIFRDLIGTPAAPALAPDSLTATSLSLLWEAPDVANLSYLLQWRFEELPGTWQFYSNSSRDDRTVIYVENLQPYTKYRFRIAIVMSGRGVSLEPVYSAPSVVMSTLESGRPGSAPTGLRAAAPDPGRVAISWKPGPFPNGPLVSYVLRIADMQPNSYTAIVDMPASNNTLFYMFQNLSPAREYEVSVAMRTAEGEGPPARVTVATPPLPSVVLSQQPILILSGERTVLAAQAIDMLLEPVELYSTEHQITGVGLDVSRDYLFVSVSNGYVYKSSLSKKSKAVPILTPEMMSFEPLHLSVDWLNQHLYVLGKVYYNRKSTMAPNTTVTYPSWEIMRCDFDGNNQLIALAGFNTSPIHFEVDPYNGYIFWTLRGGERGGLYRLDLANISNGVRHDAPPELIVRDISLGVFTVDHKDFRLLVASRRHNTVLSVSLDGREVNDMRRNTQTPMFGSAVSIAFAGGLFYWTNGNEIITEEYHNTFKSYFHSEYPVVFNAKKIATLQVLVALRSCQPIPVPVNPPIGLQSIMGINRAKVSWSPPHLLGHQGVGAWQHWSFHLQMTEVVTGHTILRRDINGTAYVMENIKEDSEYVIKVAAVTESGSGPWSSEFVGRTLASSPATLHSTLLWTGPDGLLQTDLTGDNLQTLIHRDHLTNVHITDISWYRDKLYLVTNVSTVLWYNTTSHEKGTMVSMDNVGSLAVDWVGKRIYWSNPKQQLISRGNLDGGNREPVPIVTVAKELTIDSLGAYIYWSTGHAVEAAKLNGENKMVYYPAQLFSGKQVMGLTADLEERWLYWLVRSYDGSELHRAPTADRISLGDDRLSKSLVTRLAGPATLGPLCYFSGRLLWVKDSSMAVVSDLAGKYMAELMSRVHVIAVRDPTLHAHSENIVAIPEAIDPSSIMVQGDWRRFNVTWSPAAHINHGRVYYDVSLHIEGRHKIEKTLDKPWLEVADVDIPPYSGVEVTVRAYTQWGGSTAASARLLTPQAPPAAPRRPRLYVQPAHSKSEMPSAIFRWDPPNPANGVIRGFVTQCWLDVVGSNSSAATSSPAACAGMHLPPDHRQFVMRNLVPNATYYFHVCAFTDAGSGFYTDIVSAFSEDMNPIPRIVLSSSEFIKVVDLDNEESETVPKTIGMPVDFGVSIAENVIYWANNLEEIFSSRIIGNGHYKLSTMNGTSSSVCVDWVGRAVYWAQHEPSARLPYVVYVAHVGGHNTRPRVQWLLATGRPVYNLQITPLTRTLYWYEEGEHLGFGTIFKSKTDIIDIKPFFNQTKEKRGECNCPENPQVSRTFVLDMTGPREELYWSDPWVLQIVASDMKGCRCRTIVDSKQSVNYGFPPVSITVDSKNIYWFNSTEKTVYYRDKNNKTTVNQITLTRGTKILALDPSNQPYPPKECLFPRATKLEPIIITNSANSINMEMPAVGTLDDCPDFDTASTEYTIYYQLQSRESSKDHEETHAVHTVDREVILHNLSTFKNYSVYLEATNYYANQYAISPLRSAPMIVQTAAEAPAAARDLSATVLSPVLARVEWTAQPDLWYQLYWATNESDHFQHKFQEHNTFPVSEGRAANMSHLSPNTSYMVWVRACSNYSKIYTDSKPISVHSYPQPEPILLHNKTAYSIQVKWTPPTSYQLVKFRVEYAQATAGSSWAACVRREGWAAHELRPRTRYTFRLRLLYAADAPPYYWPHDDRFTFETLGDVPGAPGVPRVDAVDERVLRAWWSEPPHHGHPITQYRVWGLPGHRIYELNETSTINLIDQFDTNLPDDIDETFKNKIEREGLVLLHNGTENYWLISSEEAAGLESGAGWRVSAQAHNARGWGPLSAPAPLLLPRAPRPARPLHAAAAFVAAALAALACAVATSFFFMYKKRLKKKAAMQSHPAIHVARRGLDVELATLRQLPIRHSTNILYNQGGHTPSDAELAALSHIRREQITLSKFLGSGAFGEVFEGVARQLHSSDTDTKVAVKTLRKGATEQEKTEFLQEAALMSNFKHDHILRLLGVCLDNDPNYIIMELMEGGDLLSYLRAKRAFLYTAESLTLVDLLSMCVDVTRGCRYLEEMHFVHRDLAARNCLVASREHGRVVKIGDFGLARDIYKNDYYRKEGEGLLPVRWMAVECLVDGVFSCQSDVWAWAVLCGEILSLGQQPYPARTNRHVLAYVRAGGTPDRPPNCPAALYELLQKCWSYVPEQRPSFKHCLEVVTALQDQTSPAVTLTASCQPPHYLQLLPDDEDFLEDQMEPSRLLPERVPKYLELMYDSDSCGGATICDGYEIPRAPGTRHSIVGVAPNRLIKPPLHRTHSLRVNMRPANATIIPLRNGIVKRASLCESFNGPFVIESPSTRDIQRSCLLNDTPSNKDLFKTPF